MNKNKVILPPDDIVIYLDETGHELLKDTKYPVFGYGGLCIFAKNQEKIEKKWNNIRTIMGLSKSTPFKDSEDLTNMPQVKNSLIKFFSENHHMFRVAVICHVDTKIAEHLDQLFIRVRAIIPGLQHAVEYHLQNFNFSKPPKIHIVFEDSTRGNKYLKKYLNDLHSQFVLEKTNEHGEKSKYPLKVQPYLMPKIYDDSVSAMLEIAHFIVKAAGRNVNVINQGKARRKDFESIFCDKAHAYFLNVTSAK